MLSLGSYRRTQFHMVWETFAGAFRLGSVIGASHGATKETETTQCTVTAVFGR